MVPPATLRREVQISLSNLPKTHNYASLVYKFIPHIEDLPPDALTGAARARCALATTVKIPSLADLCCRASYKQIIF